MLIRGGEDSMVLDREDTWVSNSQYSTIPIVGSCTKCAVNTASLGRSFSWLSVFSF